MNSRSGLTGFNSINNNPLVNSPLVVNKVGIYYTPPITKIAFLLLSGGEFLLLDGHNLLQLGN